jgi:hypothetical protein
MSNPPGFFNFDVEKHHAYRGFRIGKASHKDTSSDFSRNSEFIALGSETGTVYAVELSASGISKKPYELMATPDERHSVVGFTHDGEKLVSHDRNSLYIWNVAEFHSVPKPTRIEVVVTRWEDDQPIYNTRFLSFATTASGLGPAVPAASPNQGQSGTTVPLRGNQLAQRPQLPQPVAPQRSHAVVAGERGRRPHAPHDQEAAPRCARRGTTALAAAARA